MTISTAQRVQQAQTPGTSINVALIPAARSGLGRLQEHTGLSQADLANCAITWYAYFDTQLRAGYSLTLWDGETGKAYTLSLRCRPPASQVARPSVEQAFRPSYGLPPSPVSTPAQPWLAAVSSRGSPSAAARRGPAEPACPCGTRPQARNRAMIATEGGKS
jgi:hypothetical protein